MEADPCEAGGLIHEPDRHITKTSEGRQATEYLLVTAAERPIPPQQCSASTCQLSRSTWPQLDFQTQLFLFCYLTYFLN